MCQCGYINVTKIMVRILLVKSMKVKMNQRLAPEVFFFQSLGYKQFKKEKRKILREEQFSWLSNLQVLKDN